MTAVMVPGASAMPVVPLLYFVSMATGDLLLPRRITVWSLLLPSVVMYCVLLAPFAVTAGMIRVFG